MEYKELKIGFKPKKRVHKPTTITFGEALARLTGGNYQSLIEETRKNVAKGDISYKTQEWPAFIFPGDWPEGFGEDKPFYPSGLVFQELDGKTDLIKHPALLLSYLSRSGTGRHYVFMVEGIKTRKDYIRAWHQIRKEVFPNDGKFDNVVFDPSRPAFVSYDEGFYLNPEVCPAKLELTIAEQIKEMENPLPFLEGQGIPVKSRGIWYAIAGKYCCGTSEEENNGLHFRKNEFGPGQSLKCHIRDCQFYRETPVSEEVKGFWTYYQESIAVDEGVIWAAWRGKWRELFPSGNAPGKLFIRMWKDIDPDISRQKLLEVNLLMQDGSIDPLHYGIREIEDSLIWDNRINHPVFPLRGAGPGGNQRCLNMDTLEVMEYQKEWMFKEHNMKGGIDPDWGFLDTKPDYYGSDAERIVWFITEHFGIDLLNRLGFTARNPEKEFTTIMARNSGSGKTLFIKLMDAAFPGAHRSIGGSSFFTGSRYTDGLFLMANSYWVSINEANAPQWKHSEINQIGDPDFEVEKKYADRVKVMRLANAIFWAGADLQVDVSGQGVKDRFKHTWEYNKDEIPRKDGFMSLIYSQEALQCFATWVYACMPLGYDETGNVIDGTSLETEQASEKWINRRIKGVVQTLQIVAQVTGDIDDKVSNTELKEAVKALDPTIEDKEFNTNSWNKNVKEALPGAITLKPQRFNGKYDRGYGGLKLVKMPPVDEHLS